MIDEEVPWIAALQQIVWSAISVTDDEIAPGNPALKVPIRIVVPRQRLYFVVEPP
jgi:hypothetical protein